MKLIFKKNAQISTKRKKCIRILNAEAQSSADFTSENCRSGIGETTVDDLS